MVFEDDEVQVKLSCGIFWESVLEDSWDMPGFHLFLHSVAYLGREDQGHTPTKVCAVSGMGLGPRGLHGAELLYQP